MRSMPRPVTAETVSQRGFICTLALTRSVALSRSSVLMSHLLKRMAVAHLARCAS